MTLQQAIDDAHHQGLWVLNLFEPSEGGWFASLADNEGRCSWAKAPEAHEALLAALDKAVLATDRVIASGTVQQTRTIELALTPSLEAGDDGQAGFDLSARPVVDGGGAPGQDSLLDLAHVPALPLDGLVASEGWAALVSNPDFRTGGDPQERARLDVLQAPAVAIGGSTNAQGTLGCVAWPRVDTTSAIQSRSTDLELALRPATSGIGEPVTTSALNLTVELVVELRGVAASGRAFDLTSTATLTVEQTTATPTTFDDGTIFLDGTGWIDD